MKHYGDITKLKGSEVEIVDVVTGGSPCQDLSVAGRREGLAGERSGLFMEQIRIIKELRNEHIRQLQLRGANEHIRPRYMVWENVVGAFSSNGGEDFRVVLEETAKVAEENAVIPGLPKGEKWRNAGLILGNGWSIAWRVHDAQYHGVPQRRRRLCVLADFDGQTAGEILFELRRETASSETDEIITDFGRQPRSEVSVECESLSGNIEQGKEQGQATAGNSDENAYGSISFQERAGCEGGGKGILVQHERTGTLSTLRNQFVCNEVICEENDRGKKTYQDVTGSLMASGYSKLGTREAMNDMYVCSSWDGTQTSPTLTAKNANGAQRMPDKDNFNAVITFEPGSASRVGGHFYEDEVSGTVRANAGDNQQAVLTQEPVLLESNQNHATVQTDGVSTSLPASMGMGGGYVPMVTYGFNRERVGAVGSEDLCPTIQAAAGTSGNNQPMVCLGLDRASFNQGKNAKYDFAVEEEKAQPIVARGPGGGTATVGSLCARDYKGVGNQYVAEGKCVVQFNDRNDT